MGADLRTRIIAGAIRHKPAICISDISRVDGDVDLRAAAMRPSRYTGVGPGGS